MKELVILLEEPSAKEVLDIIIPKIAPELIYRCFYFQGKQDLEKNITRKLKGYQNPDACFLIIRDKDAGDCIKIKEDLLNKCRDSGKKKYKVRIMCHELETIYLADLKAVEQGLKIKNLVSLQEKKIYRQPDLFPNPKKTLKELAIKHNGFYSDIAGSRAIAPYLDLNNKRSSCFFNLINAIKELSV